MGRRYFVLCWVFLGTGQPESHMIPWRLVSDMGIVSYNKTPMHFCAALWTMTREKGLTDFSIWDHELSQQTRAVPVPCPMFACLTSASVFILFGKVMER